MSSTDEQLNSGDKSLISVFQDNFKDLFDAAHALKFAGVTADTPNSSMSLVTDDRTEALKATTIDQLQDMLNGSIDAETRIKLEKILSDLQGTSSPALIERLAMLASAAISEAHDAGGMSAGDMREERISALWHTIETLNSEIKDILYPHMSEEEQKKDAEFRRLITQAETDEDRLKIEQRYTKWREDMAKAWSETGTETQRQAAEQAKPKLEEVGVAQWRLEKEIEHKNDLQLQKSCSETRENIKQSINAVNEDIDELGALPSPKPQAADSNKGSLGRG